MEINRMIDQNEARKDKSKATAGQGAGIVVIYVGIEEVSNGSYEYGIPLLLIGLALLYMSVVYNVRVSKNYTDNVRDKVFNAVDGISKRMDEEEMEE